MSAVASPSTTSSSILSQEMRRRRLSERIGRIGLAVAMVLTAVIIILIPVQAAIWMQNPFIGAMVEPPGVVQAETRSVVGARWPALEAGLQTGDRITAVNSDPVERPRDLYRTLRQNHKVGDVVVLSIDSAESGGTRRISVDLIRFPAVDVITSFLLPYLVGIGYLVVGLWVYRNRRDRLMGRLFLTACIFIALISITTFDLWTTHTFVRVYTAAFPLAGWALATLAFFYPNDSRLMAENPERRWLMLVPVLGIVLIGQILISFNSRPTVAFGWWLMRLIAVLGAVVFMGGMVYRAIFAASPSVREQSRMVLIAAVAAALPFFVDNFGLANIPTQWNLAALLIFPAIIAYTVLQYNVLDTGRIVSYAATYSIMAFATLVGYAIFIIGINQILIAFSLDPMQAASPVPVALLTFAVVLLFDPVRSRLQNTIDALFFQSRSEYDQRLTQFRNDLTDSSSLSEIVRLLKQQLRETLVPTHAYVYLRDAHSGDFSASGEGSRPDTDIRFELNSGLVNALSKARDVIFLEFNKPLPPEMTEDHARLAVVRTPVMAPLQGQEGLAGWIAVGNKRSGDTFKIEDLRFIQALADQASLAVERAQVISDLERRVRELDVLSQVSQAVNFTTGPDVLLELIYTQSSKLLDTTNFYIMMHDPMNNVLEYVFFLEEDERFEDKEGTPWPDNLGLASEVVRTGQPIRTEDYLKECSIRGIEPRDNKHYSWLGVPLTAGNRNLGVMIVASYTQGVLFTDEQMKIFWRIADQAATALDKARLFSETEERARQLATLNEISQELSSTLDLENLLLRILRSAVNILNVDAGTLFLVDENTGELVFRVVEGGSGEELIGVRIPPGTGIVGQAAEQMRPVISNDTGTDEHFYSEVDKSTDFKSERLLAVPMIIQEESIGVVEVINRKDGGPFTNDDAALLTTFASQAAIAIENARLYQATDAALSARVDELQALQRIDRELNRTLNFDRVINITLDWALRTTGCMVGSISMLTPEEDAIMIIAAQGYTPEYREIFSSQPIPLAEAGIVGRVLTNGKPEFVEDISIDSDYVQVSKEASVAQITVPILRANKPIGALIVESHREGLLTENDFEFIQRLAEHAAVAIENARLVDEIEAANRSKTEFISFVAHELKNPMTSIRGYTDLLKSGQLGEISETQVQFLSTIRSNVDRMTRLVSDLADTARIESGNLRIEIAPTHVSSIIDETVTGLQAQIDEKQQTLKVEIPAELPPIAVDPTRMAQIMTNLLSNAHKYTPEGGKINIGADLEIAVDPRTGDKRRYVHHFVSDTGIGMSEEDQKLLFTKFYRTARGKDMAQGTGLGLNITKSLVEAHQGLIWVESAEGEGTTFHFTIPVHTPEPE